jgi:hypothetical protein
MAMTPTETIVVTLTDTMDHMVCYIIWRFKMLIYFFKTATRKDILILGISMVKDEKIRNGNDSCIMLH